MTALTRSFVYRARILSRHAGLNYADGEADHLSQTSDWFKCRLQIEAATEGAEQLSERATYATLTFWPDCDLRGADRVEVEAETTGAPTWHEADGAAHASSVWQVDGEPLPLMRGRRIVARRARLRQVAP